LSKTKLDIGSYKDVTEVTQFFYGPRKVKSRKYLRWIYANNVFRNV